MCLYFTQTQKLCSCYYYLHAQFHSLDHRLVDYLLSQILEKKTRLILIFMNYIIEEKLVFASVVVTTTKV